MLPGDDEVLVKIDDNLMLITIDRPKANAIDLPTSRKLGEAFVSFRDSPELKVAIITGAGGYWWGLGGSSGCVRPWGAGSAACVACGWAGWKWVCL